MDSLDNFRGSFSEQFASKARKARIPVSGTFELLPICNMKCKMCYIQQNPIKVEEHGGLQSIEFWDDIFDQSVEQGMLFPLITGGEPFLYPDFMKLYEKVIRKGIHLCINTNATLLDREIIRNLAKNPPRKINISLYGGSEETYGSLCQNPAGFERVLQSFELLNEYGIPFRVHSTLVPDNIHDYDRIIEICNKYRAPLTMVNYMFPAYRKDNQEVTSQGRFSALEMAEVSLKHNRNLHKGDTAQYKEFVYLRCAAMEDPSIYSLYNNNSVACNGGICTFWVDWKGNLSACGVHAQNKVDLHEVSFKEAWQQVISSTDEIRISEKCKTCRYRCICPVCPASCFCETGDISGTPQYLCDYSEEYARLLFVERDRLTRHE